MRYHVIDSVKGGCGKSSFAIMLAGAVNTYHKEGSQEKIPVCIFDMDLQGTSMAYLLFGKNWKEEQRTPDDLDIYLDERIANSDSKGKHFIKKVAWRKERGSAVSQEEVPSDSGVSMDEEFYVAVSSPIQKDKDKYKPRSSQNYSPGVSYGRFRYGLSKLLTSENLFEELRERLEHVILDMPPNSDGYSDAVTDFLLDAKGKELTKDDSCSYFIMVTRDLAHQQATLEWLNVFLSHEPNRRYVDKLVITLAITPRDIRIISGNEEKEFKKWVEDFGAALKQLTNWSEEWIDNIYFIAVDFKEEYYAACCECDGIINRPMDISNPILYMCPLKKEKAEEKKDEKVKLEKTSTQKFLELLCE